MMSYEHVYFSNTFLLRIMMSAFQMSPFIVTADLNSTEVSVCRFKTVVLYWLSGGWRDQSHREHVLEEFKDLDRLTHHARVPIHPCFTIKDEEYPGPHEFANFLENVFASEIGFESRDLKSLVREMETTGFGDVEPFTMVDLQNALKNLRRNKCADSYGIVAKCFVYGSLELHEHLLRLYNLMLVDGHVEE